MKYLFCFLMYFQLCELSSQLYDYDLAIKTIKKVQVSITNKDEDTLYVWHDNDYIFLMQDQEYIDIIEEREEGKVAFVHLRMHSSQKIEYSIKSMKDNEMNVTIDGGVITYYNFSNQTYRLKSNNNTYVEWNGTITTNDPNYLFVNMYNKVNSTDSKNFLNMYIQPDMYSNDTLKRTLASVAGFMRANFYNDELFIVDNQGISNIKVDIEGSKEDKLELSSCCTFKDNTIHIFTGLRFVEFAYLHELMHYAKIEKDYNTSEHSKFLLLPDEQNLANQEFDSIRSNFNLYTNKFKLDIGSLISMYRK